MDERVKSYGVVTPEVLKSYDGFGFLRQSSTERYQTRRSVSCWASI